MSNKTKPSCATPYKTMIGGQALIEGIMMLGPEKKAVVVRKPDGELEEQVEERVLIKDKHPLLGVPLHPGRVQLLFLHGQWGKGADVFRVLFAGGRGGAGGALQV